jgi:transcriptional regulator with XRE-family HTH domain
MGDTARDERRAQGRRIRQARNAADLTLMDVRDQLWTVHGISVTPQAISAWERGETTPRPATLAALLGLLGLDGGES